MCLSCASAKLQGFSICFTAKLLDRQHSMLCCQVQTQRGCHDSQLVNRALRPAMFLTPCHSHKSQKRQEHGHVDTLTQCLCRYIHHVHACNEQYISPDCSQLSCMVRSRGLQLMIRRSWVLNRICQICPLTSFLFSFCLPVETQFRWERRPQGSQFRMWESLNPNKCVIILLRITQLQVIITQLRNSCEQMGLWPLIHSKSEIICNIWCSVQLLLHWLCVWDVCCCF